MAKTASEVVEIIKETRSTSPGIEEIRVDGIQIKLDRKALDYWEKRAAREALPKTRPIAASIDLGSSYTP